MRCTNYDLVKNVVIMNIEGFKNWILKNEPKEAPKVEEHIGSLQVIEKLLGKNLDDVVSGGDLSAVVNTVKGLLGKASESGSAMDKVKGLGGLLGGANDLLQGKNSGGSLLGGLIGGSASGGSLLGGLAEQAKGLLSGKVDIAFLLGLYQKFFKSSK